MPLAALGGAGYYRGGGGHGGDGGSVALTRGVTVAAPSAPSLSLQASPTSLTSGDNTVLTWSTSDVTSCTASGAWNGARATLRQA